jgi:hypothetical protein
MQRIERVIEHPVQELDFLGIRPPKTAGQLRLRADGLRVHFLARLCTA